MAKERKRKANNAPPSVMTEKDRDAEIRRLERERIIINEEIEGLLRDYAKESKDNSYKPRKRKFGKSANDYTYENIE